MPPLISTVSPAAILVIALAMLLKAALAEVPALLSLPPFPSTYQVEPVVEGGTACSCPSHTGKGTVQVTEGIAEPTAAAGSGGVGTARGLTGPTWQLVEPGASAPAGAASFAMMAASGLGELPVLVVTPELVAPPALVVPLRLV